MGLLARDEYVFVTYSSQDAYRRKLEIMNVIRVFVVIQTILFLTCVYAIPIQDALRTGKVKVTLTSNGKSMVDGMITAQIQSVSMSSLELQIPVGVQLISGEDERQNLILVHEELFTLSPKETKVLHLKGMCIEASNSSPGSDIVYTFGELARGDLLLCAQMIYKNKVINSCGQEAIWVFTDNHDVGWIDAESENERALRQFVADKKGVKNPWFTTAHKGGNNQLSRSYNPMQPTTPYYDMSGAEIKGDFVWSQSVKMKLTFAVYDVNGNVLRKFFENKDFDKGDFTFKFFYKTTQGLRGSYYAKVTCGDAVIRESTFSF